MFYLILTCNCVFLSLHVFGLCILIVSQYMEFTYSTESFCLLLLLHSTLTILRHHNAFHSVSVSIENYNKFGKQRVVTANKSIKLARFFRGNFSRGGVAFTTGIISSSEITATQEIPFINPFQGIRTRSCLSIYFRS